MDRQKYKYSSMNKEDSIRNQIIVVACINLGQIIVGYSTGWSAPISSKLRDPESSPLPEPVTELQLSWIGSLLLVGSLMGPYLTGPLSNTVGRKPCIILGGILNILTYLLVVMTRNVATIYALRVISGLGMGITTVCNIVYVGEIASTHIRGILLTSTGIVGICGTLLVYAAGPYVSYAATGYIALAISIAQVIAVATVPESPVFYAMKGKEKQLINSLNRLGRPSDYKLIKDTYSTTEKSSNLEDWTEIFTVKSNRVSFFITFCLVGLQQLNGAMAVLLFATTIFEIAGSSIEPDVATIVIGATRLVPSVLAPALIERTGRKLLLMISQCACAVSLTILGIYFYLDRIESSALDKIGWLPLVALVMFFFSYESGFGPIPNTIVGEMYRANVRANGSTLSMTLAWALGFALTTSFSSMVNTLGGDVTFWIFSGACVVAFLFTYIFVPETKGKTLDEIQEMMS